MPILGSCVVVFQYQDIFDIQKSTPGILVQPGRPERSPSYTVTGRIQHRLRGTKKLALYPEKGRKITKEGSGPKNSLSSTWSILNVKVQGYESKQFACVFVSSGTELFLHVWSTCSDNCAILSIAKMKEVLRLQTIARRAVTLVGTASM